MTACWWTHQSQKLTLCHALCFLVVSFILKFCRIGCKGDCIEQHSRMLAQSTPQCIHSFVCEGALWHKHDPDTLWDDRLQPTSVMLESQVGPDNLCPRAHPSAPIPFSVWCSLAHAQP